jgi:hypothetical protein
VEPFATPPATEYDSASSLGDPMEVMSLAGTEPEMEEISHWQRNQDMIANERKASDEGETEAEQEGRMQSVQNQYRRTQSILADMTKGTETCGTGLGRGQSLWSFVFQ